MLAGPDVPGGPADRDAVLDDLLACGQRPQRDLVPQRHGVEPEWISRPATGGGYAHELVEVTEAVAAGRTESTVMPLEDTLTVQRVLGEALEQLGVAHREDRAVLL